MIDKKSVDSVVAAASAGGVGGDLSFLVSVLDHTSLGVGGQVGGEVRAFTRMAMDGVKFDSTAGFAGGIVCPATVCVYPAMVESVGLELGESPIGITAVCGGFPSGMTFVEVKMLECAMAIENGANEIDVVINVGAVLGGEFDVASAELAVLKDEIGDEAVLKVILETAVLQDYDLIYRASMVAMEAGADFVKSCTGFTGSVTPQAVAVMCMAVRDYYVSSGRKCGVKVSGGVSTVEQAGELVGVVRAVLGEQWCDASLFRIGSSRLLADILGRW